VNGQDNKDCSSSSVCHIAGILVAKYKYEWIKQFTINTLNIDIGRGNNIKGGKLLPPGIYSQN